VVSWFAVLCSSRPKAPHAADHAEPHHGQSSLRSCGRLAQTKDLQFMPPPKADAFCNMHGGTRGPLAHMRVGGPLVIYQSFPARSWL
jgi:hypothetical protein